LRFEKPFSIPLSVPLPQIIPIVLVAAFSIVYTNCTNDRPYITDISPKFGSEGDIITINGEHFGEGGEQAYITIAGERPTASSYTLWQDDTIKVKITRSGVSGLVYVFSDGKQSNGVVFSDRDAIPQMPRAENAVQAEPMIDTINPKTVSPGDLLTITGNGFGVSRENTGVFFTWDITGRTMRLELPVSVSEGGYESWGEREIRVRVPDGTGTGLITVTDVDSGGRPIEPSGPVVPGGQTSLDISQTRGKKTLRDSREYIVALSTDVIVREATVPNALYLAVPSPVSGASQQITRVLSRMPLPFAEYHRGTTLYRIADMKQGETVQVSVSYLVTVCVVETTVVQPQVSPSQDMRLSVYKTYLGSTPLIPAGNKEIAAKAASITGRERNPYLKAQLIYRALLNELTITATGGTAGPTGVSGTLNAALAALQNKTTDSYGASLLFSALCRAAGIPAAPYGGVLVNADRSTVKHYWTAFWIDGIGWIPVDLAFGAGAAPENWTLRADHAAWYFGNMDNQRIAFSFGETILSPVDPRGRTAGRDRAYALQNIWEEAVGGLESYSSLWSDVSINGIYYPG
jgi:transglutaminase-like putative cysteine protease